MDRSGALNLMPPPPNISTVERLDTFRLHSLTLFSIATRIPISQGALPNEKQANIRAVARETALRYIRRASSTNSGGGSTPFFRRVQPCEKNEV